MWEQSRLLVVLNYAALCFAIVMTVVGTERIARRCETLSQTTFDVIEVNSLRHFREMNGVRGPLIAAVATAIAFAASALASDGWTAALLRGATWFVLGIALWTFLWTYVSLQIGLDRVGREHLRPDAARVDPTLGLRPLGGLAFMGCGYF